MTKTILIIMSLSLAFTVTAKDLDFTQMTEAEKQASGIDKLSPSEQAALLRWISQKQQAQLMNERKKNLGLAKTARELDESEVKALLVKQYSNKLGDNFYQLDNGQIWKQVSTGRISINDSGPQVITIEPGFMGSWTLSGDGNRSVKVKRIK